MALADGTGEPVAERIQVQNLRLQLSKAGSHQLQVVVQELLRLVRLLLLRKNLVLAAGTEPVRSQPRNECRGKHDQRQKSEPRDRQMARHNGDRPCHLQVA